MNTTGNEFPDFALPAVIDMKIKNIQLSDFKKKYIGILISL